MNKEFVTYEIALELKQLGFDEPCFGYYESTYGKEKVIIDSSNLITNSNYSKVFSEIRYRIVTPTFSQAFRWFREKYGLHPHYFVQSDSTYVWCIRWFEHGRQKDIPYSGANTYEEAEHACILKLIELAKQKGGA